MHKLLSAPSRPLLAFGIAGLVAAVTLFMALSDLGSGTTIAIFADQLRLSAAFEDPFGSLVAIFESPFDVRAIFENPFGVRAIFESPFDVRAIFENPLDFTILGTALA